jgi:hypothetical protein
MTTKLTTIHAFCFNYFLPWDYTNDEGNVITTKFANESSRDFLQAQIKSYNKFEDPSTHIRAVSLWGHPFQGQILDSDNIPPVWLVTPPVTVALLEICSENHETMERFIEKFGKSLIFLKQISGFPIEKMLPNFYNLNQIHSEDFKRISTEILKVNQRRPNYVPEEILSITNTILEIP